VGVLAGSNTGRLASGGCPEAGAAERGPSACSGRAGLEPTNHASGTRSNAMASILVGLLMAVDDKLFHRNYKYVRLDLATSLSLDQTQDLPL